MCRSEDLPPIGVSASAGGRIRAVLLALMGMPVALAVLVTAAPSASAAESPRLSWSVNVNGQDVRGVDANAPLRLSPQTPATVGVRITNLGSEPVRVRSVRLEGRVLGLAFYSYTTRVDLQAAPGASDERRFTVDLLELDGQATGLIPSRVALLDDDGNRIASDGFAVDVRGSLRSVYGVFGLAVAAITLLLLVSALWRLLTGRLHPNRWRRGMTWCAPGLGAGFTLTFTLSALRLMVPSAGAWALLLLVGGAIGFAAGYLTPTPDRAQPDRADQVDQVGRVGQGTERDAAPRQPLEPSRRAEADRPPVVDLREPAAPPAHRAQQSTRSDRT